MKAAPTLCVLAIAATMAAGGDFPPLYNSEKDTNSLPLPPAEAAASMQLPPGFRATVFAAEPDVQNPIAMTWDGRGRLWIAENYTYAERALRFDLGLRDRVLIFEDKDNDGHFDSRKVFTDDVQMLTSIEVGHGGVWLMCPPRLLFLPDRNGDDVPDGPAETVLDGFTVARDNYHNFANGLRWGPDGWLYGRCGASCPGLIGRPGTPDADRMPLLGGMWRYHPARKIVEVLNSGTTNPWGHDWTAEGEPFFVNTVNGHLWHAIPGAHFDRPHTTDPNPSVYELIDLHADHWHFDTGKSWTDSRDGKANNLGGGHAHQGTMIYQGDNWPAEYRGRLFTLNFHGRRLNQEILERNGSGYVAHHGQDFFLSADPWFRGIDLSSGPDGGVFVLDWSDTGECHDSTGVHRTSGRIFKITYGEPRQKPFGDMRKKSEAELVELHRSSNEWFVRQARLTLAERAEEGASLGEAKAGLKKMLTDSDPIMRLRVLLSLKVVGAADEILLRTQLRDNDEHLRAWAIRLLTDDWLLDGPLGPVSQTPSEIERVNRAADGLRLDFTSLAKNDPSGLVRLTLASTLQRLPVPQRADLAAALVTRTQDANDHNLPLLVWYGLIPVANVDPSALVPVAAACEWPKTRRFIARRLAEDIEKNPQPINELLNRVAASKSSVFQIDILSGVGDALAGWRRAKKPVAWDSVQQALAGARDAAVRDRLRELSAVFGDGRALEEMRRIALDGKSSLNARSTALQSLIDSRPDDLRAVCERLLNESHLNVVAARGLAMFDDPAIGGKLVQSYNKFHFTERPQLLSILVSRKSFAAALLSAVSTGGIPRADLSAFHVRQIRSLDDPGLNQTLTQVWGELRDSPDDKRQTMARLKASLTPEVLSKADKSRGRAVFGLACAVCHRLYGEGAAVGPDLTGSGRDNLDYLLENIVDPSAVVNADFRMSIVKLKDGRVLNGIVAAKTDRTLTIRSLTETLTIERSEVVSSETSAVSQMPEGLLESLSEQQVRDIIAYLRHPTQVPLPAAP